MHRMLNDPDGLATKGYEMVTLVAFSGGVEDTESGPEDFTEANMNPPLHRRSLA